MFYNWFFLKPDQYERSISKHGCIRDVTWSRCSPEQQELKCFLARVYLLPVESTSYYWSVGNKNNDLLISSTDISCVWWCGQYPLLVRGWVKMEFWSVIYLKNLEWTVKIFFLLIFSRCSIPLHFALYIFGKKSFQINRGSN